ncbi:hypothetical protein BS78_01G082000 [Paspalum vaginatum]|nr:hypothetical protein BS78_01G082000 [Paspalum vaginatum]
MEVCQDRLVLSLEGDGMLGGGRHGGCDERSPEPRRRRRINAKMEWSVRPCGRAGRGSCQSVVVDDDVCIGKSQRAIAQLGVGPCRPGPNSQVFSQHAASD